MPRNRSLEHARSPIVPRVKIWLERDGRYVFGHRLCEILRAVERTGSIKHAAEELGYSYRYVRGRIKKAEGTLGQPLVMAQVGGKGVHRSELTDLARSLMADFSAARKRMLAIVDEEFKRRRR